MDSLSIALLGIVVLWPILYLFACEYEDRQDIVSEAKSKAERVVSQQRPWFEPSPRRLPPWE